MSLLLILALFINPSGHRSADSLEVIRASFHQSVIDEDKIPDFVDMSMQIDPTNGATFTSYKAAGYVLMAKKTWNPVERIALVIKYKEAMDRAVALDPENVEIRFLRFSIAYYLPDVLGFKKDMEKDKQSILDNLDSFDNIKLDPDFNRYILWFINHCRYYSPGEISRISEKINAS